MQILNNFLFFFVLVLKVLVLNTLTRSDRARRSFEVSVRLEDGAVLILDDHGETGIPAP